jgi:acyl-coenzyme A thioesterase PaaI-like protein
LTSERSHADSVAAAAPRFELAPHNCFACGTLNEHGLHLELHVELRRSWCELALDRRFEGWDGIAHGGILCTLLDEVMAWALVGDDNWGLTARLSVDFHKPVEVGRAIRAEGWITGARRRIVDTAGRILDPATGVELASATAVYVAADEGRKRALRERYGFRLVDAADDAVGDGGVRPGMPGAVAAIPGRGTGSRR